MFWKIRTFLFFIFLYVICCCCYPSKPDARTVNSFSSRTMSSSSLRHPLRNSSSLSSPSLLTSISAKILSALIVGSSPGASLTAPRKRKKNVIIFRQVNAVATTVHWESMCSVTNCNFLDLTTGWSRKNDYCKILPMWRKIHREIFLESLRFISSCYKELVSSQQAKKSAPGKQKSQRCMPINTVLVLVFKIIK